MSDREMGMTYGWRRRRRSWGDGPAAFGQDRAGREVASAETGVICSVAVDLHISNVVDVANYVVSALLPEEIFWG
jgi:hypothetical protein